jgi:CrcB protein
MFVNIVGSLLVGIVWTLAEEAELISREQRVIALTGFMGAFTTFSTFAFETTEMLRESQLLLAVANIGAQNVLGIAAVIVGASLVRALT